MILGLGPNRTRRLLAHLAMQGWLTRVRHGLYATVPLSAEHPAGWPTDPWKVAASIMDSGYVGGWSALEHWDLTDQLFRDLLILSPSYSRKSIINISGGRLIAHPVPGGKIFGTRKLWRDTTSIDISDPTRTVADVLSRPHLGGGIRHVGEALNEYFFSQHRDDAALLNAIGLINVRTAYKRLGYLTESLQIEAEQIISACLDRKSKGYSWLDPSGIHTGSISKRWNLKINANIGISS